MQLRERPASLKERQALAAIGQSRLMRIYDDLFSYFGQPIGQVLVTRGDLAQRSHYERVRGTFLELLYRHVVPIMNENDTIAQEDHRFHDNDTVSAIVAAMVDADWLFLLTDVDALYDSNPRVNPAAKPIRRVQNIDELLRVIDTGGGTGSCFGTGGMATKIAAARLTAACGCRTVIANARFPERIEKCLQRTSMSRSTSTALHTPPSQTTVSSPAVDATAADESAPSPSPAAPATPVSTASPVDAEDEELLGTIFEPRKRPIRDGKRWISHALAMRGELVLDDGACEAIRKRNSLFAAGIVEVRAQHCPRPRPYAVAPSADRRSGASGARRVPGLRCSQAGRPEWR